MRKNIVVLTGAGISAESGIPTFRDNGGTWSQYNVEDVATLSGWNRNPSLVLEFYNKRRNDLANVYPNEGHKALVELEKCHDVYTITQNVDDLHERAGSTNILHLHGELLKCRSEKASHATTKVYPIVKDIELGDLAPDGGQIRPHIVWFEEDVPDMFKASRIVKNADVLLVIGTSLNVYPAASLIRYAPRNCQIIVVDPKIPSEVKGMERVICIEEPASTGVHKVLEMLIEK